MSSLPPASSTPEAKSARDFIPGFTNATGVMAVRPALGLAGLSNAKKVIVVGAGIAGVTAALKLVEKGYEVTLLESRGEVGGRIRTHKMGSGIELPEGPAWLHGGVGKMHSGETNPLVALLKEAHVELKPYNHEPDPRSLHLIGEDKKAKHEQFQLEDVVGLYQTADTTKLEDQGEMGKFVQAIIDCRESAMHGITKREVLDSVMAYRLCPQSSTFDGNDMFVLDGYQPLINMLYQKALRTGKLKTVFNTQVLEIDCTTTPTVVKTKQGVLNADAVVCALPAGVLQKGAVTIPGLSPEKVAGFKSLQFGRQNKVFLEFEKCFWEEDSDHLVVLNTNPDPKFPAMMSYVNVKKFSAKKPNILMTSFYADQMQGINEKTLDEKTLIEIAVSNLREAYGAHGVPFPNLIEGRVTYMNQEPTVQGCWSRASNDTTRDHLTAFMNLDCNNTLVFCGDYATLPGLVGTVSGAYHSATAAIEKLLKALEAVPAVKTLPPISI